MTVGRGNEDVVSHVTKVEMNIPLYCERSEPLPITYKYKWIWLKRDRDLTPTTRGRVAVTVLNFTLLVRE